MQERAFKLIAQVLDAVKMPRRVAHTSAHCDQRWAADAAAHIGKEFAGLCRNSKRWEAAP